MTSASPPPPPDLESAHLLIAELRRVTDRFAQDLDAPVNAIEISGSWFDLCDDLTQVHDWANRLRDEAFQTSIRASAPGVLPERELRVAREFSARMVEKWRAS